MVLWIAFLTVTALHFGSTLNSKYIFALKLIQAYSVIVDVSMELCFQLFQLLFYQDYEKNELFGVNDK